ncbi:uncharacterized protein LOC132456737 isoform X2 [Gadus macrocephalus]|uniref:uncharacterized protein LOC132456737 isoform X2 n=1 Tax=Gadus macrocephalus TaxID=80720 RepID=UPI0028CB5B83|nr:uncharacterized protein LOC132456737 isoform X2 [Gadus macrocephalus]
MSDCAVLKCHPELGTSFHYLPKDPVQKQKWLDFIYKYRVDVDENIEGIRVCSAHFSNDSFQNHMQKAMGFAKKLILKHDAIPTIYPHVAAVSGSQNGAAVSLVKKTDVACQSYPVCAREIGLQCFLPAKSVRTVGTQLSEGTLMNRKSHGGQTRLTIKGVGAEQPLVPDHHRYQEGPESLSDPESSSDPPSDATSEESGISESTSDVSKYIVYDSSLLRLLDRCPTCSHKCQVNTRVKGSFLSVHQQCRHCEFSIQHSEGHLA